MTATGATARTTHLGTPCARSWSDDWIARVEAREAELGGRICGARTIGHAPCPAPPAHANGRCGHHGGFDLTGGQPGNRNAAVHMLYAHRLMPCGAHCPNWASCPLGGAAPDQGGSVLDRAEADRPRCPFEQAEYSAVVTDTLRRTQYIHQNAWGVHIAHQIALLTVMVSRAAKLLATKSMTADAAPSAGFVAYEKLSRELRRWTLLLETQYRLIRCDAETVHHHRRRQTSDTGVDPDAIAATASGEGLDESPVHDAHGHQDTGHHENPYDPMNGHVAEYDDPADPDAYFGHPPTDSFPDLPKFQIPPGIPVPPFPWYERAPDPAHRTNGAAVATGHF